MYCQNCGNKVDENAKYCVNCGKKINNEEIYDDGLELEEETTSETIAHEELEVTQQEQIQEYVPEKKSLAKKIFSGIGIGGAVVGGGLLYLILYVLRFLYIASAGLGMVWLAITLFRDGSVVWGLLALFIGTPVAIGIASFLFLPLVIFSIVALVIWGLVSLFGIHTSFGDIWGWLWFIVKVLVMGFVAFSGISEFISAIRHNRLVNFFKENWFYIILFFVLLWLFF